MTLLVQYFSGKRADELTTFDPIFQPGITAVWTTRQLWFDGLINGMVFGLLALGIVLIYRSTRVINLAVGNMGLPASGLVALLTITYNWPFWIAFLTAMIVGTTLGAIVERAVIRRLFESPRVIVLVATIGIAQLMQAVMLAYPSVEGSRGTRFPVAIANTWENVMGIRITGAKLTILVVVPLITLGLAWFLNRTVFGQTVQASASNTDLARLSGINPKMVSLFVWTVAGALSSISLIMLSGTRGGITGLDNLGPNTMVRALAAAVIAGMVSFPRALIAGIGIGIFQAHIQFIFLDQMGLIDLLLFILVVAAVAFQSKSNHQRDTNFSFAPRQRPIPEYLRQIWWVRHLNHLVFLVTILFAALLPFLVPLPSRHLLYSSVIAFAICAISLAIVTGWAGQLSLGQMAFAGIGALAAAGFNRGLEFGIGIGDRWNLFSLALPKFPYLISMVLAATITAGIAAAVGLGALRVRGLFLAISTFAFALAAQQYIYRLPFLSDRSSRSVPFRRGSLGPFDLTTQKSYYLFCLLIFIVLLTSVAHIRKSGIGRSIIAVRDNESTAAAYTVSPTRTKLLAFSLAGGIAGLGGALLGGLVQTINHSDRFFLIGDSLRLISILVIGGVGSILGPVVGSLWVIGLPAFWPNNDLVPLFTSSIGLLVLLLYFPGGLTQIGYTARNFLLTWAAKRYPETVTKTTRETPKSLKSDPYKTAASHEKNAILAKKISVNFGGIDALSGASLHVKNGEVVGLIGTNGAGKSTLMNAIGGFVSSTGKIELLGKDVTGLSPSHRAQIGLGRTFQQARLFPELTVKETVQVALEARERTGFFATCLMLPRSNQAERSKRTQAEELIDFLGLGRYADTFITELSTGTRRIVELASLLALKAKLLCLDEPTAGVAQRESEAFGPLLLAIRDELNAAMLVIEHDMPMIMSLSDRVYCLEAGEIIAEGVPNAVRHDPRVVSSYLGTDDRAIRRSNF